MSHPAVVFVATPSEPADKTMSALLTAHPGLLTRPGPDAWAVLPLTGSEGVAKSLIFMANDAPDVRAAHVRWSGLLRQMAERTLITDCLAIGEAISGGAELTPAQRARIIEAFLAATAQRVRSTTGQGPVSLANANIVVTGLYGSPDLAALYRAVAGKPWPERMRMSRVALTGFNLRQPGGRLPREHHAVRFQ
jgi:hypothetical protein